MTLPASRYWNSVTYGSSKFVAVAGDPTSKGAYSIDGVHWVEMTLPDSRYWYSVAYDGSKFVAVVDSSDTGAAIEFTDMVGCPIAAAIFPTHAYIRIL